MLSPLQSKLFNGISGKENYILLNRKRSLLLQVFVTSLLTRSLLLLRDDAEMADFSTTVDEETLLKCNELCTNDGPKLDTRKKNN